MAISFETEGHITDDEAIALVEKRVNANERARFDAHTDTCDQCRELVAAMAMASSLSDSEMPEIALDDSSGLDSIITPYADLDDSIPTQIYASLPPADDGGPLEAGDLVGHFRIMRALGRGAMGEVYLARDTMLGRKVALKVIAADLLGSERAMRRFLFEAKATARFNHPNIVTIHAVGEHGDRPYVALEYVEGENLRERSKRERLPLPEILRIGLAVADALAEAHAAGILHRDLKPANVIIGSDGRVRLLDFGLAKAVHAVDEEEPASTTTSSSTWLVGTPRYMAPEQWRGGAVEGTADVFALGVILFELCSGGVRPFDANNTVDLLRLVTSKAAARELSSLADVPDALSELVARCIQKAPADRPSAHQVADGLRALLYPERSTLSVAEGPFRGLLPFTERHASVFFGRDAEIAAFLERLRIQPVLPVLGPSGAGKSSLIQAGVVPRLRELGGWVVLQMRPGPRPFETLASRLERRDSGVFELRPTTNESGRTRSLLEVEARAEILRAAPRRLSVMLRELADAEDAKVLLFVDQLEEIFTMVDAPDQKRFLEAVCTAADDVEEPVRVVLALRHDFVDRLSTEGELGGALSRFMVLKTPDAESLRQILAEPVKRAGYRFEDERLVDQMIAAVQGEPACLPLLQFAAAQLWDQRDDKDKLLLTRVYDAMGGVGGALGRHADSLLDALPSEQQTVARTLLLRLVTPERTRRIISKKSALDGLGSHGESVLKQLTDARLVSVSKMRRGDDLMLELAHESLMHTWRTLAEWIEHSEDELRILGEVTQAAELWHKRGRRATELWGHAALGDVDRVLDRSKLPELVTAFVGASRDQAKRVVRRQRLGLASAVAGVVVIGIIAVVAAVLVARTERNAEMARQQALHLERQAQEQQARLLVQGARKALEEGFPLDARAQVRRALELRDTAAARALWHKLQHDPAVMRRRFGTVSYDVDISADGQTIAVASHDGRVYLVNTATGAFRHLDGHVDAVAAVSFTADGRGLVSSDLDGNVVFWELATFSSRSLRRLGKGGVLDVQVSPDDRHLVVASQVGARVLDLRSGDVRLALSDEEARAVRYALGGKVVAVGGATLRIYDARSGKLRHELPTGSTIERIAVSDDGTHIAAANDDGKIMVVRAQDGTVQHQWQHATAAKGLAFGPAGKTLTAAGGDGVAVVIDTTSGAHVQRVDAAFRTLGATVFANGTRLALVGEGQLLVMRLDGSASPAPSGHEGVVHDVRFAPDGQSLASAGADGTIRIWELASGRVQRVLRGHGDKVWRLAFAPNGTLASAGNDGTVRLWDATTGVARRVLGGHEDSVLGVAFSADGSLLASGGQDRSVRLWNVDTGAQQRVLRGHQQAVTDLAFSPKGDVLATASLDKSIRLWPLLGIESKLTGHTAAVTSVSFDPDGERLVSASADKTIRLWPLAGGATARVIDDSANRVQQAAFHPDGTLIGIASNGGAQLLSVGNNKPTKQLPDPHPSAINALRFDTSGAFAASAGDDGTVRVWSMTTRQPHWRGVALLPEPPRSFTHRGWQVVATGDPTDVDGGWSARIASHARYATQAIAGGPVCLLTDDGALEMWRVGDSTRVQRLLIAIDHLIALPTGCAARSVGAVHLLSQGGEHRELAIGGAPHAIGWGEQRLLVATENEVLAFSESGERIGQHQHELGSVAALTQVGSQLVIGHHKRNIILVGTSPNEPPSVARFERASQSSPSRLTAGPRSTLVAGYEDGTVALFDTVDGALLLRTKLHGAITHALMDNDRLYVATALGDTLAWPLQFLTDDYCELLRTVWRSVPVVWEQGEPTVRPPPAAHACR